MPFFPHKYILGLKKTDTTFEAMIDMSSKNQGNWSGLKFCHLAKSMVAICFLHEEESEKIKEKQENSGLSFVYN